MLSPYADILRTPGAFRFSLAAFVGRLPMSMLGLGSVLLVSDATGSYGVAGAVGATIATATAIGAPQVGRLVDRFGQHRVLAPAMALHVLGVLALIAAAALDAPHAAYFLAAFVTGLGFPSFGSLVRARWTHALGRGEPLQTAFALESVLDEIVFVVGPVLATLLATAIAPAAGLLTGVGFLLAGGSWFALQRATEPPPVPHHAQGGSAMRVPGLIVLACVLVGLGGVFGTLEVSMVAFAQEHGREALAGPLLALFAISSAVAGVLYGAHPWRASLQRRLTIALGLLFAATIPLALADTIATMAVAAVLVGMTVSPTLIASFGLVEAIVPRTSLTEGFAWMISAMGIGLAGGLAVAGLVVDAASGHRAFAVAVPCSLLAVLVVVPCRRLLARRAAESAPA